MAYPRYLNAYKNGALQSKIDKAVKLLEDCSICPRKCRVNRLKNEHGFCRTGRNAIVCSYFSHHGEEPPISGTKGSGTIFFSHCNMSCVYCQNYEFSQLNEGREIRPEELASYMISLQQEGCHNINFVTPTHVMPQILEALKIAAKNGLKIPLVYNTSGYELPEMIQILDGIIDIYLPDMRYSDNEMAVKYSKAPDYPKYNQDAMKEMFRQVNIACFDKDEVTIYGLIIRHLVLPENISGTKKILQFISQEISPKTYISLMSQYRPCFEASKYPEINEQITLEEYERAIELMREYGFENGWIQESGGLKRFAGTNIKRNI